MAPGIQLRRLRGHFLTAAIPCGPVRHRLQTDGGISLGDEDRAEDPGYSGNTQMLMLSTDESFFQLPGQKVRNARSSSILKSTA